MQANVDLKTKCTTVIEEPKIGRVGRGTSALMRGLVLLFYFDKKSNVFKVLYIKSR